MYPPKWIIFYSNRSVVSGVSEQDWLDAPDKGVQVVVLCEPTSYRGWMGVPFDPVTGLADRQLWTGEDTYDPFGWGVKYGSLISDATYFKIWERASRGNN